MRTGLSLFLFFNLLFLSFCSQANVTLPSLVSSDMVLQQNSEIELWGWADPLEEIEITPGWNGETLKTVTDSRANWSLRIRTPKAGGPYEIKISGYNQIVLSNIMIGEVWICSGQSNMQWPLSGEVVGGEEEIEKANLPDIRLFQVVRKSAEKEQIELNGSWQVCSPETVKHFSAVGYKFAKVLNNNLDVPIGIINSSWGGTPAEAWIPHKSFSVSDSLRRSSSLLEPAPWGPQKPSLTYNSMIHPLIKVNIAGVIWYQGEGNTINAPYYEFVFKELIRSWRELWKQDFPFYYVQIAPFSYGEGEQGVLVREAQRRTLKEENTGMVVISDIGDLQDIHPKEKLEVGNRLGRLALKKHYRKIEDLVESPEFADMRIEKKRVHIRFEYGDGLHFDPDDNSLFEISGADGIFYPAKAKIEEDKVVLFSKEVKDPVHVRFAWGNTSVSNLYNRAGLPASSFTTGHP